MILPHLYHVSVLKELFLAIVQMPILSALMLTNFKVCEKVCNPESKSLKKVSNPKG